MNEDELMVVGSTPSTNTLLASVCADKPHGFTVVATKQTAGRGQRGNSWESDPGKNLTFSVLLRPEKIEAASQFSLSEAVSLAVAHVLTHLLAPYHLEALVKWPNDIYVGDRKICGILIENTLSGKKINHSIVGIGINVNQSRFVSDAPNPTSLTLLAGGRTYILDSLLGHVVARILEYTSLAYTPQGREEIHRRYMSALWRREGLHPYRLPEGEVFLAEIAGIAPTGHLTLRRDDGSEQTFAFKEVAAVI